MMSMVQKYFFKYSYLIEIFDTVLSFHTAGTEFPDCLLPSVSVFHRSRQAFQATSCISTELMSQYNCILFILRIVTWNCSGLLSISISYLKPLKQFANTCFLLNGNSYLKKSNYEKYTGILETTQPCSKIGK